MNKKIRLNQVAREFDISPYQIAVFLSNNGKKIKVNPNENLSLTQYELIKNKFGKTEEEQTGIEDELESEKLEDPFNPDQISIEPKVISMDSCLRRLTQGSIKLNPDFQRNEIWTLEKKSQLIESFLLRIPIPMFYVSADEKLNYTVVDGLQRLSTIRDYILGEQFLETKDDDLKGKGFKLKGLEFWKELEGLTFLDLPVHLKNRIYETEFRFTVINPGTPEEVRRNIFKRINTGGLPLSSQEIRNALYSGKSTILLNELAKESIFIEATAGSVQGLRMADKELILRLLSFFVRHYSTYRRTVSSDTFLSETMIIINAYPDFKDREYLKLLNSGNFAPDDIAIEHIVNLKELFLSAMKRAKKIFGKHTFRRSYVGKRRSPINKSLFEMWGFFLAKLTDEEFSTLNKNKNAFLYEYKTIIENSDFQTAISRNSMKHTSLQYRFITIESLINKYI